MADRALAAVVVIWWSACTIRTDKLGIVYCFSSTLHTWLSTRAACALDFMFVIAFAADIPVWMGIAHAFPYPDRFTAHSTCRLSEGPVEAMVTMASMFGFALTVKAAEMA